MECFNNQLINTYTTTVPFKQNKTRLCENMLGQCQLAIVKQCPANCLSLHTKPHQLHLRRTRSGCLSNSQVRYHSLYLQFTLTPVDHTTQPRKTYSRAIQPWNNLTPVYSCSFVASIY